MCLNKKWEIEIIRQGRIENSSERKTSDVELREKNSEKLGKRKNHRNYQTLFKLIIVKNCDTNILFTSDYTHDHFTFLSRKEFVNCCFFFKKRKNINMTTKMIKLFWII